MFLLIGRSRSESNMVQAPLSRLILVYFIYWSNSRCCAVAYIKAELLFCQCAQRLPFYFGIYLYTFSAVRKCNNVCDCLLYTSIFYIKRALFSIVHFLRTCSKSNSILFVCLITFRLILEF